VPVVATDAGGMPEVVKDGETGLLVRVGDFRMVAEALSVSR
jgi:2-deoxystreptamine N-acetyl-D-glucosaminyltransferase/2-deoxystreptamine glucosyltransferase